MTLINYYNIQNKFALGADWFTCEVSVGNFSLEAIKKETFSEILMKSDSGALVYTGTSGNNLNSREKHFKEKLLLMSIDAFFKVKCRDI